MICRTCGDESPDDATFCIGCGASLPRHAERRSSDEPRPATGRTVVLDSQRIPVSTVPPPTLAPAPPRAPAVAPAQEKRRRKRRKPKFHSFPIFMIGVVVLLFTGNFWPGILALIGITGALDEIARGRMRDALAHAIFFVGMAVVFANGIFWPWIVLVFALSAIVKHR